MNVNDEIFHDNTDRSREWLREQAAAVKPEEAKASAKEQAILHGRSLMRLGRMYMFRYMPAGHLTLPYYDTFPVIFPFRMTNHGFHGINFHYLPHTYRAVLMDNLYSLVNNEKYDESTHLQRMTYTILNNTSRFRFFRPCVRQYLNKNVSSRFVYIPPSQWDIALFLPLERFVGATRNSIHQDSKNQIRKYSR